MGHTVNIYILLWNLLLRIRYYGAVLTPDMLMQTDIDEWKTWAQSFPGETQHTVLQTEA